MVDADAVLVQAIVTDVKSRLVHLEGEHDGGLLSGNWGISHLYCGELGWSTEVSSAASVVRKPAAKGDFHSRVLVRVRNIQGRFLWLFELASA